HQLVDGRLVRLLVVGAGALVLVAVLARRDLPALRGTAQSEA
ncbi:MAG: hypothetical protein JWN17_2932, partial [Frankiales bacterium]|nr:hypothetical protein [Frankiales bacterium]